ncbi:MAG TPA: hypothetical protein VGR32_07015 [Brevundimonas sp.]|jgi:hypothetical protein|uniref:hypothetical protein n=1 Tax=Brevundimonas sp. TaxID=1871086 RepID=UPI002DEC2A58|nr:hypothetical protein [Brevundimonas sp.]
MKVACIVSAAALALGSCATPPTSEVPVTDGNDCAVIAAVAREHYGFNATDRLPPPLWLGDGRGWSPVCDWSRHGLVFPDTYDPHRPYPEEGGALPRDRWVSFRRPKYDGQGATIESSVVWGPLMGEGVRCRVRSGFAGWTVERCEQDWIS